MPQNARRETPIVASKVPASSGGRTVVANYLVDRGINPGAALFRGLFPSIEFRYWGHYTDALGDPVVLDADMRAHAYVEDHIRTARATRVVSSPGRWPTAIQVVPGSWRDAATHEGVGGPNGDMVIRIVRQAHAPLDERPWEHRWPGAGHRR